MADLSTIMRGAPIGLLLFLGTYLAARRRRAAQRRAGRVLPAVASRLGLEHRAAAHPGGAGSLRGSIDGWRVFVDADDRPRIVVYFGDPAPRVVLRTYEHEKRLPAGMQRCSTGNEALDRLFKERYAAPDVVVTLEAASDDLAAALAALTGRLRDNVAHLTVTAERIECAFDFGRPPHVPPEIVEELVPALVRAARVVSDASARGDAPVRSERDDSERSSNA